MTKATGGAVAAQRPRAAELVDEDMLAGINSAIRSLRGDMSQAELCRRFDEHGMDVPQSTLSRWERGGHDFYITQLVKIATVLGVDIVTFLQIAGIAEAAPVATGDVVTALLADPSLDDDLRQMAVQAYKGYRDISSRMRAQRRPAPSRRRR